MSKMLTPEFVGSFVTLVEPSRPPGTEAALKYSITIVLPKDDKFWKEIQKAIVDCAKEKFGKVPKGLKSPVKDGDESDYGHEGMFTMTASAKEDRKPEVVMYPSLRPIIDVKEIYSGAIYMASIRPYAWSHAVGGKGVSFGLDNVMKMADGDPLDGRSKATDDFAAFASEASDVEDVAPEADDDDNAFSLLG